MGDIRAYLDVVELLLVDIVWDVLPAAIPRHFELGIISVNVGGKVGHLVGCGIATHKADAGDALAMLGHKAVDGFGIERRP